MSKVITVSRTFPAYHPKAGQPTHFVEKIWRSLIEDMSIFDLEPYQQRLDSLPGMEVLPVMDFAPKHHTIRAGKRWKDGDMASLRVWSDKPYRSPQVIIAPDVQLRVLDIEIAGAFIYIDGVLYCLNYGNDNYQALASNDGLSQEDLHDWFPALFSGQMLIWNSNNLPY